LREDYKQKRLKMKEELELEKKAMRGSLEHFIK